MLNPKSEHQIPTQQLIIQTVEHSGPALAPGVLRATSWQWEAKQASCLNWQI